MSSAGGGVTPPKSCIDQWQMVNGGGYAVMDKFFISWLFYNQIVWLLISVC